jgi:hypothetical protein
VRERPAGNQIQHRAQLIVTVTYELAGSGLTAEDEGPLRNR